MEKATWDFAKKVFHDALEREGADRDRIIREACGEDSAVLAQVEALLGAHDRAGDFLGEVTVVPEEEEGPQGSASGTPTGRDPAGRFRALQSHLAGRYSFEGELGRGGMGVVYLARDVSLDRPVAIKLLATDLGGRAEARERFLREARTAARLSHPNIVPVHAVEEHDDLLFFVMAFIDGETIRERVERTGPLAAAEVSRILQEVAWALDYAHGRGVIHRDIKPDNIILERGTGRAVVTDFGIARAGFPAGFTTEGALLGTPEYVSPEQALGNEVDGRSDVYSLGVTCFFSLTGHLPFEAQDVQGMLAEHVHEPPPSVTVYRPEIPRKLARALDQCLSKDPRNRWATAEELAKAVSSVRIQAAESPPALGELRRAAEMLAVDGVGFGVLAVMATLEPWGPGPSFETYAYPIPVPFPPGIEMGGFIDMGIMIAVWLLTFGLVGSRAFHVIARARIAMAQGFTVQHLTSAFRGRTPEVDGWVGGRKLGAIRAAVEAFVLLASLALLAYWWIFVWQIEWWIGSGGSFLDLVSTIFMLVMPVVVGRALAGRAIRLWPGTRHGWARLWRGHLGRWFFQAAGIGLGKKRRPGPAAKPTEAMVAGAAAGLFGSLPSEYQARLEELPALVRRLEAAAGALRGRGNELERALVSIGTIRVTLDRGEGNESEFTDDGSVQAHRLRAARDLDSARALVESRLSSTMAALENLRLGLLRLQAGVGSPDELTADLKAAREIGREVQALLNGERQVEDFLAGGGVMGSKYEGNPQGD